MSPDEELSAVDEEGGMNEYVGVSDFPHGHGLWSPGCKGWMAKGSGPMASVGLSPNLV